MRAGEELGMLAGDDGRRFLVALAAVEQGVLAVVGMLDDEVLADIGAQLPVDGLVVPLEGLEVGAVAVTDVVEFVVPLVADGARAAQAGLGEEGAVADRHPRRGDGGAVAVVDDAELVALGDDPQLLADPVAEQDLKLFLVILQVVQVGVPDVENVIGGVVGGSLGPGGDGKQAGKGEEQEQGGEGPAAAGKGVAVLAWNRHGYGQVRYSC